MATPSFKPFCLGFGACAALTLALAAGPRWLEEPPPDGGGAKVLTTDENDGPDGPSVDPRDLPEAVLTAVHEADGDLIIESASINQVSGLKVFEIKGRDGDGQRATFLITRDGTVLEHEEAADVDDLPDDLLAAIHQRLPGAEVAQAGIVHSTTFYVVLKKNGKHFTAVLAPDDGLSIEASDDGDDAPDQIGPDVAEHPVAKAPGF